MKFSRAKLQPEEIGNMHCSAVAEVRPFSLMASPVYVLMKLNNKVVAIKSPLDFFTPSELDRFRSFGNFYFLKSMDFSAPFIKAAGKVRSLLTFVLSTEDKEASPAPFEVSDAVLRIIGSLWSSQLLVDPFFVAIFANEVCDSLNPEKMIETRNADIALFERALLISGWAVFVALHLGHCDLKFLNNLRNEVFDAITKENQNLDTSVEVMELQSFAINTFSAITKTIDAVALVGRKDRVGQKLAFRLNRVRSQLVTAGTTSPTIYSPGGFADV